jgi:WD40 repeat protein
VVTLKASQQGLAKIKQARLAKGWAVDDFRWIEKASEVLGVFWEKEGFLAVGISEGTWKRFLAGKSPINAAAFKAYCQVLELNWEEVVELKNKATIKDKFARPSDVPMQNRCDWGEAPDVSIFYGRLAELNILERWIVQENCRLVTLLGMGGIGKTALSVKVAQQIQDKFDFIIWRSLRNAPPIEDILAEIIQFLSGQQETNLPKQLDGRILRALQYLRSSRCLLILDNIESILQSGDRTGRYRAEYEGYGQFLRCIAETSHQSCLILTSREKPKGLAKFEGEALPVRSLQLSGLPETEGRELFNVKGSFTGSESQWNMLISRYGGNPLALKIVASSIRDFFEGSISQFLEISRESTFIFDDIRDLLDQQFHRLTNLEREIMYWLAINREPVSLPELQSDFVANVPIPEILESLSSLQRRSLVEKSGTGFTQQPVVMEYAIAGLIEVICDEIYSQNITLFKSHALIKATAKDYVRETQISLILKRVADRLIATLGTPENIATHLRQILSLLQGKSPQETGYAGGNSLNLLHQLQVDLSGFDFSDLTVWQAYLQGVNLHDVNFANSDLSRCVFTETLGNILSATFSPDGQILATCDTDCHVRLWEVKTGKLLLICQGHNNWVRAIAFSLDGQILASCGADCTVKLWNVQDGICIKTLMGHDHEVFSVAFSPIPPTPLTKGGEIPPTPLNKGGEIPPTPLTKGGEIPPTPLNKGGEIPPTPLNKGGEIPPTPLNKGGEIPPTPLNKGGYGGILASASGDRTIKIWDIETGSCLKTLTGHTDWVRSVAFSLDGQILASGSADCTIKLWDVADGKCLKTLTEHTGWVREVAFSPIRPTPLTKGGYAGIPLTKGGWGDPAYQGGLGGSRLPRGVGGILASCSSDRTIKLWDISEGKCLKTYTGHSNAVYSIAFNPIPPTPLSKGGWGDLSKWKWRSHCQNLGLQHRYLHQNIARTY